MTPLGRSRALQFGFALLAVAACVNVAAAMTLALRDSSRASDLWMMGDWCRAWLIDGASLYTSADSTVDYPPHAIVLLSPLALVPRQWLVPLWTAAALALTPVLPWLVLRSASPRQTGALEQTAFALLYLCWAAPRTLLQFSLLSMTLAWLALSSVDSRPTAAGVALGLALFKPHIAGPVALWMLIAGRIRPIVVAGAVVLFGGAVYVLRIGESPLTTAAGWWHVIGSEYGGPDGLVGHTSIRDWTQRLAVSSAMADAVWIAASATLLAALCAIAMRDRSRAVAGGGMAIPAMFCMWSLLAVYHNGNNMILMLPAFAYLWARGDRQAPRHWIPLAVLQAALSFDVPVRLNRLAASGWTGMVIEQFDRLVVLATLALVAVAWCRQTRNDPASASGRVRC